MTTKYDIPPTQIYYPSADGEPMAESDFQRIPLSYAVEALDLYFEDRPDVYVSGNIFVYYEEGRPASVVAPDVLVVIGVPKRKRRSYMLWQEGGKAPDFVLEITSSATWTVDQGPKWGTYSLLGVREYFQYDPTADYLNPVLKGWRLNGRNYDPLPTHALNGTASVFSEVLGLELRADLQHGEVRFYTKSGRRLPSYAESEKGRQRAEVRASNAETRAAQEANARQQAETRAAQEVDARQQAEARAAQLEAELERLRAELARRGGEPTG